MLITEDKSPAQYQIRSYQQGEVTVNEQKLHSSFIISPEQLITDWQPRSLPEVNSEHFEPIFSLKPEILFIGTGNHFQRLATDLIKHVEQHQIGVEIMDNAAACRTYMALLAEGRNVVAAIIID